MSNELKVAIEAAKAGAKVALKYFNTNLEVTYKAGNSPVTMADRETEETIKNCILQKYPHANFVGEETGGSFDRKSFWIIDPIDGTRNFIRGLPFWSVLIALYQKGGITLGVSYMPLSNELITAEIGKGAYCNNKKVSVSKISSIKDAYINYANPKYFKNKKVVLELSEKCASARGFSNPYGFHLQAQGKFDINVEPRIAPWDIAPFKVIIEEAGGKVTNFEGKEWTLIDTTAVATNGLLHDEVIRILNT